MAKTEHLGNRAERRRHAKLMHDAKDRAATRLAEARWKNKGVSLARKDGRPLYFDCSPADRVQCHDCVKNGVFHQYSNNEAFICDPCNSPGEFGTTHTICREHLPDNAVIYDPGTATCRNKAGDNVWKEGNEEPIRE